VASLYFLRPKTWSLTKADPPKRAKEPAEKGHDVRMQDNAFYDDKRVPTWGIASGSPSSTTVRRSNRWKSTKREQEERGRAINRGEGREVVGCKCSNT